MNRRELMLVLGGAMTAAHALRAWLSQQHARAEKRSAFRR
jgi:hypothetical protein